MCNNKIMTLCYLLFVWYIVFSYFLLKLKIHLFFQQDNSVFKIRVSVSFVKWSVETSGPRDKHSKTHNKQTTGWSSVDCYIISALRRSQTICLTIGMITNFLKNLKKHFCSRSAEACRALFTCWMKQQRRNQACMC